MPADVEPVPYVHSKHTTNPFLIFFNIIKGVTGGERFISQLGVNIQRKTLFWERFPENWGASLELH